MKSMKKSYTRESILIPKVQHSVEFLFISQVESLHNFESVQVIHWRVRVAAPSPGSTGAVQLVLAR
jgi:hypothetical protein